MWITVSTISISIRIWWILTIIQKTVNPEVSPKAEKPTLRTKESANHAIVGVLIVSSALSMASRVYALEKFTSYIVRSVSMLWLSDGNSATKSSCMSYQQSLHILDLSYHNITFRFKVLIRIKSYGTVFGIKMNNI